MTGLRVKPSKLNTNQSGFTLIEVVVALAILASVAIVASQASSTYLRSVDNLKTRTFAHFVAQNTAASLQIDPAKLQALSATQVSSQGRHWQVTLTTLESSGAFGGAEVGIQSTLTPVLIQVAPMSSADGKVQHNIADLTTMVSVKER